MLRLFLLLFIAASLIGCGTGALVPPVGSKERPTESGNPVLLPSPVATRVPAKVTPLLPLGTPQGGRPVSGNPATDGLVAMARADLTRRLGVEDSSISLVRIEGRDWPDTSLGCPRPGQMYAQVITPGYLIVLSANGQEYEYHASTRNVIPCNP